MSTVVGWVLAFIALICLVFVFPFVQKVFDYADANGTGILHQAGGTPANDSFLLLLALLVPAMLVFGIIVYAIRGKQGRGQ